MNNTTRLNDVEQLRIAELLQDIVACDLLIQSIHTNKTDKNNAEQQKTSYEAKLMILQKKCPHEMYTAINTESRVNQCSTCRAVFKSPVPHLEIDRQT